MSIANYVRSGDIQGVTNVLAQVLKDKLKENRWSEYRPDENNILNRAFYETGGICVISYPMRID